MASLTLDTITKSFGQLEILHGIDLDIADGEFVVFVGPSGCGKSTLLRVIAGLEPATGGTIAIDGEDVTHHSAAARGLAMWSQGAISGPSRSFHIVDFPDPLWPATTIAMGWPDAARRSNTCWTAAARVVVNGP